jgi:DNA-binding protein Fis
MKQYIYKSKNNQSIYKSLKMARHLPINILLYGNVGLGKKVLIKEHFTTTDEFFANDLEDKIIQNSIDLKSHKQLIIYDIDKLINKKEFFEKIKNIRFIATGITNYEEYSKLFALKLHIKDLKDNIEDLDILKQRYIQEAKTLSSQTIDEKNIPFDLSLNAISLKQSIYKAFFSSTYNFDNLAELLENYIYEELKQNKTYKELISSFEIPLLRASKTLFHSQVKIADALNINRITLRKKLQIYSDSL